MKLLAVGLAIGLSVVVGCGGGLEGQRPGDEDSAGSAPVSNATAGSPTGVGGAAPLAGAPQGGAAPLAGSPMGGSSGASMTSKPCGPAWTKGTDYKTGDIVSFDGGYYIAEHENPGYDPTVSTYFWEPYSCPTAGGSAGSGSGGSISLGGGGPLGESAFDDLVSESLFNQMFPDRDRFYTYQGLVDATRHYPLFSGTGTPEQQKREAAAFLANVSRETGELVYIDQIAKEVYCQASAKCPCEPGKLYYGRGPIQISWNYNYCSAGAALGIDLRAQPELVSQNATVAWETGLWFWMTQRGAGTMTPHDAITGDKGFGETIRAINGSIECTGNGSEGVTARVSFYQRFCTVLGVAPGDNQGC